LYYKRSQTTATRGYVALLGLKKNSFRRAAISTQHIQEAKLSPTVQLYSRLSSNC